MIVCVSERIWTQKTQFWATSNALYIVFWWCILGLAAHGQISAGSGRDIFNIRGSIQSFLQCRYRVFFWTLTKIYDPISIFSKRKKKYRASGVKSWVVMSRIVGVWRILDKSLSFKRSVVKTFEPVNATNTPVAIWVDLTSCGVPYQRIVAHSSVSEIS